MFKREDFFLFPEVEDIPFGIYQQVNQNYSSQSIILPFPNDFLLSKSNNDFSKPFKPLNPSKSFLNRKRNSSYITSNNQIILLSSNSYGQKYHSKNSLYNNNPEENLSIEKKENLKNISYKKLFKVEKEHIKQNKIQMTKISEKADNNNILEKTNNLLFKFNYYYFRENYYSKYENYTFTEPQLIPMKTIIDNYSSYIGKLWNNEIKIFDDKSELISIEENSIVYKDILKFLKNEKGGKKNHNSKRSFEPDEMVTKIKTYILRQIIEIINSFSEMKNSPIEIIKKFLINNKIKSDFNLIYLEQYIYSIVSNDASTISKISNCEKIKNIMNSNNINEEHESLIEFLNLTFKDCLKMFTYQYKDKRFSINLCDFLIKEYKNFKIDDNISDIEKIKLKKNYIATLLLIAYNFERVFFLKLRRGFKNDKKNLELKIKSFYFKLFINKLKRKINKKI